jgi:hypothetical protein
MEIFFPMAGQGARFGHKFKPFLTIDSETFIEAAVRPFLEFAADITRFVFVYLESQEAAFGVSAQLAQMFAQLPIQVVQLPAPTRGPAETICGAVEQLRATGPAFICDCDHALDVGPLFRWVANRGPYDALLPVWRLEPDNLVAWSVAMVESDQVVAIAEKQLPSGSAGVPMGVIGCYGFADIARAAARARQVNATNFSDVIREMLADHEQVTAVPIERARFFGDPERLARATRGVHS